MAALVEVAAAFVVVAVAAQAAQTVAEAIALAAGSTDAFRKRPVEYLAGHVDE